MIREVGTHLVTRGHHVEVFTTDAGDATRRAVVPGEDGGMKIHAFPNLSPRLARTVKAFFPTPYFREMKTRVKDFDVVHVIETRHFLGVWAAAKANAAGVPAVLSPHGSFPNVFQSQWLKAVFDALLGKQALKKYARFHVLTEAEKKDVEKRPETHGKIVTIPNGITLPPSPDATERIIAREQLGLSPDDFAVLYLGRLHAFKGMDLLLLAFAEAMKKAPAMRLLVAGPNDGAMNETKATIKKMGLTQRVTFLGFLDGVAKRRAYVGADIFSLLSRWELGRTNLGVDFETIPITVLEALSYGLGVVVSEAACAQGVVDQHAGIAVPTGDYAMAANALVQLADNRSKAREMGLSGRKVVAENYSWDAVVEKYEALYRQIIHENNPGSPS